jgi:hypothetical protein
MNALKTTCSENKEQKMGMEWMIGRPVIVAL